LPSRWEEGEHRNRKHGKRKRGGFHRLTSCVCQSADWMEELEWRYAFSADNQYVIALLFRSRPFSDLRRCPLMRRYRRTSGHQARGPKRPHFMSTRPKETPRAIRKARSRRHDSDIGNAGHDDGKLESHCSACRPNAAVAAVARHRRRQDPYH
jgi:hypothetical protein